MGSVGSIIAQVITGIFVAAVGLGIPVWFITALIGFNKNRKKPAGEKKDGPLINFVIASIMMFVWGCMFLIVVALLIFAMLIVANM